MLHLIVCFKRVQMLAHYLFLAFKLILVYFQHYFNCSVNGTFNHTNLVHLIICLTNNDTLQGYALLSRKNFPENVENLL